MEWDGKDEQGVLVPTSIYIIRMIADDFETTLKIILLK